MVIKCKTHEEYIQVVKEAAQTLDRLVTENDNYIDKISVNHIVGSLTIYVGGTRRTPGRISIDQFLMMIEEMKEDFIIERVNVIGKGYGKKIKPLSMITKSYFPTLYSNLEQHERRAIYGYGPQEREWAA